MPGGQRDASYDGLDNYKTRLASLISEVFPVMVRDGRTCEEALKSRGIKRLMSWELGLVLLDFRKTSLTEFRHQMRSGDLLVYLSLNCFELAYIHVPHVIFFEFSPFLRNSTRM